MQDLLGTEFSIINGGWRTYDEKFDLFVAQASYEKGITAKEINTEVEKFCINREEFIDMLKKHGISDPEAEFKHAMDITIKQIRSGLLDMLEWYGDERISALGIFVRGAEGSMTCAFS